MGIEVVELVFMARYLQFSRGCIPIKEPVKIGEGNNKAKITYNIHFQAYRLILLNPPFLCIRDM